jgi:hypothetical protein
LAKAQLKTTAESIARGRGKVAFSRRKNYFPVRQQKVSSSILIMSPKVSACELVQASEESVLTTFWTSF